MDHRNRRNYNYNVFGMDEHTMLADPGGYILLVADEHLRRLLRPALLPHLPLSVKVETATLFYCAIRKLGLKNGLKLLKKSKCLIFASIFFLIK